MQENQNSVHCPLWLHLKVVTSLDYMIDGLKKKMAQWLRELTGSFRGPEPTISRD